MGGQCIGLLSNEAGNFYLAEVLGAFIDAALSRRFRAVAILGRTWRSPEDNEKLHNEVYRFVPFMGLRGQVVASALLSTYEPLHDLPRYAGLADDSTVYLGGALAPGQYSVELEAGAAIRSALRHLVLEHGCARVACVTGPSNNPESILRLRAYRQAVRELGLPWTQEWEECGHFSAEGGQQAMRLLLERLPGLEGVFFLSDAMALGAMQYFESARLAGQRRPRIIGFDDIEELHYLDIPLSTIAQPLDQLMEASIRPLAGDKVPEHVDVSAELVLRRSCGCEQAQGRTNVRSAFHEGLDLLFHQQKLRMATQALLRDRKPSQWDLRVGEALRRMGIAWAAVLEWPVGLVPASWAGQEFRRLAVYENGELSEGQTRLCPQASVLAEVLADQCEPVVVEPLVNGDRFHGLLLLRHVHGMEQTYDSFAPLLAAAWSESFSGGD